MKRREHNDHTRNGEDTTRPQPTRRLGEGKLGNGRTFAFVPASSGEDLRGSARHVEQGTWKRMLISTLAFSRKKKDTTVAARMFGYHCGEGLYLERPGFAVYQEHRMERCFWTWSSRSRQGGIEPKLGYAFLKVLPARDTIRYFDGRPNHRRESQWKSHDYISRNKRVGASGRQVVGT